MADILNDFISAEVDLLNEQDIKHPTTIGSMYEGLTQEIFHKSIFKGLNLKVITNSFIEGCSTEFDVMLVEGDGEKVPYTDRYKYAPEKVIAIVQSKKNLYSKDIGESYNNLKNLIDFYDSSHAKPYVLRLFNDSFRAICRKEVESYQLGELTLQEEYIYHSLKIDALLPARIVWGYNGFKSEYNFRESYVNYIGQNLTTDFQNKIGYFGPHNFPDLTICGKYSIGKHNGMPFITPIQNDSWWPFLVSSSYNPTYFFLEVLWSKLTYRYSLSMDIFGEDLTMEPGNRFLDCRIQKIDENIGWEFNYFGLKDKALKEHTKVVEWQPTILDSIQHVIISELCKKGEIDLDTDKDLEKFVKTGDYVSLEDFLTKLNETGLTTITSNKLRLLTDQCQCAILPDGRFVAGENKSGRLMNWVSNYMKKR